jgi:outer membrane protein assembly factor BamB
VIWRVTLGDVVSASPSAANGVVYVAADDGIVHALNSTTGTDVHPPFVTGVPTSDAVVANGVVYFGDALGRVFALG